MTPIRERLAWALVVALSLMVVGALAGLANAGPLDPTAPPGSTDRTVITSLPYTISQPGSYVLKSNLTGVSGQNGITVAANSVTIDLQGFEMIGVAGSLHAIAHTSGSLSGLTVRNGTIRVWGGLGISAGSGLYLTGVSFRNNAGGIIASDGATLTDCRVESSVGSGVILGNRAVVTRCASDSNGPGCNTCPGFQVGQDSTITESVARNNGGNEIVTGARANLENCTANGNATAGYGISVGEDSIVRGCAATGNGGDEIQLGDRSLLEDCIADGWTGSVRSAGYGILPGSASAVRGCTVANNGYTGIYITGTQNRIDGNHIRANSGFGIYVTGSFNAIVQNDSAYNITGDLSDNCNDAGTYNRFVIIVDTTGAGAFDNICG